MHCSLLLRRCSRGSFRQFEGRFLFEPLAGRGLFAGHRTSTTWPLHVLAAIFMALLSAPGSSAARVTYQRASTCA